MGSNTNSDVEAESLEHDSPGQRPGYQGTNNMIEGCKPVPWNGPSALGRSPAIIPGALPQAIMAVGRWPGDDNRLGRGTAVGIFYGNGIASAV